MLLVVHIMLHLKFWRESLAQSLMFGALELSHIYCYVAGDPFGIKQRMEFLERQALWLLQHWNNSMLFPIFLFFQVLRKKPEFHSTSWQNISPSAKDFVKKLLVKDPKARLTAAQALCRFSSIMSWWILPFHRLKETYSNPFQTFAAHPWVREGGDATDIPLDISVLSNMREFVKYSRLKQIALRVNESDQGSETVQCMIFLSVSFPIFGSIVIRIMYRHWQVLLIRMKSRISVTNSMLLISTKMELLH